MDRRKSRRNFSGFFCSISTNFLRIVFFRFFTKTNHAPGGTLIFVAFRYAKTGPGKTRSLQYKFSGTVKLSDVAYEPSDPPECPNHTGRVAAQCRIDIARAALLGEPWTLAAQRRAESTQPRLAKYPTSRTNRRNPQCQF